MLGGTPRLDGTRIGVFHIYRQYQDGASPEAIASNYDGVTVADVHNALAFVFDNPALLRNQETAEENAIERIREQRPVDPEEFKPQP